MDHRLSVYFLPQQAAPEALAGSTVVVIDVLRATSAICQALASGACEVVPFLEVDDTLAAAEKQGRANIVLGGERGGTRIEGFDLGNSPAEYSPQAVAGRRVFITTTNGTRAMHHARLARRVVLASFLNLSAVAASVKEERRIEILCASTDGHVTGEDILAAGAMADRLASLPDVDWQLNDAAAAARREWQFVLSAAQANRLTASDQLAIDLRDTTGGRNLIDIGLDQDLVDCAQIDRLNIVPALDVRTWRITANAPQNSVW